MHNRSVNALRQRAGQFDMAENSAILYTVNWAPFLDTDTISTSTWTTEDSNLTIASESNTTTTASARLSGEIGRYRAVNKVVTAAGDTFERYVDVTIKDNSTGYAYDYGML